MAQDRDRDSQRDDAFTWSGTIPSGRRIMIKNINGAIEVERSTSGRVEVRAEKRWRRGNPADVRIEQKKIGDDVLVCALFSEGSQCDESGIHTDRRTKWNERNDVSVRFTVRFTVRVPDGVWVDLSTVNGRVSTDFPITISGTLSPRRLRGTVGNGATRLRASTVNGSVTLRKIN